MGAREPAGGAEQSFAPYSRTFCQLFFPANDLRTLANNWQTPAEFAQTLADLAANWQTFRQRSVYVESFSTGFKCSANDC